MSRTQLKTNSKQIQNDNIEQNVTNSKRKTTITLEDGKNATTMQVGKLYPITFKEVLAGETLNSWDIVNITRIITPFVPTMDTINLTIKAFFVPHTRVWKNANKILAQSKNADTKGTQIPNMTLEGGQTEDLMYKYNLSSRYGIPNWANNTPINVLLHRGYRAIYNDYIRNKEYTPAKIEWNEDTPVTAEQNAVKAYLIGTDNKRTYYNGAYVIENAPFRKSYLTNIKRYLADMNEMTDTEIIGGIGTQPATTGSAGDYIAAHLDWQTRFQEAKQRSDNANKNDWDIIADIGGTQPINYGQVTQIGEVDYELNYQQITQSTPEVDGSSPLGATGAFSYTKQNGRIINYKEFKEHGFIHILASVNYKKTYENSTPKEIMKTTIDDLYRPANAKKEIQLIDYREIANNDGTLTGPAAYQPAWAEYKRLPSFASGEMQTKKLQPLGDEPTPVTNSHWHNMIGNAQDASAQVITGDYFNNAEEMTYLIQRNTAENVINGVGVYGESILANDPIMNMSLHRVKTSLPMEESTIKQYTKAEVQR